MRLTAVLAGLLLAAAGWLPRPASAGCKESLEQAATRHGVPPDLMVAVGRVESGLHPYAVNAEGRSTIAPDAATAVALVEQARSEGLRRIDVGCGQINLYWHPFAFADLNTAFDPEANAEYAAAFMASLFRRHGDWTQAVAHYHSNRPEHQQRYVASVSANLDGFALGSLPSPTIAPSSLADGWDRSTAIAVFRVRRESSAATSATETAAGGTTSMSATQASGQVSGEPPIGGRAVSQQRRRGVTVVRAHGG